MGGVIVGYGNPGGRSLISRIPSAGRTPTGQLATATKPQTTVSPTTLQPLASTQARLPPSANTVISGTPKNRGNSSPIMGPSITKTVSSIVSTPNIKPYSTGGVLGVNIMRASSTAQIKSNTMMPKTTYASLGNGMVPVTGSFPTFPTEPTKLPSYENPMSIPKTVGTPRIPVGYSSPIATLSITRVEDKIVIPSDGGGGKKRGGGGGSSNYDYGNTLPPGDLPPEYFPPMPIPNPTPSPYYNPTRNNPIMRKGIIPTMSNDTPTRFWFNKDEEEKRQQLKKLKMKDWYRVNKIRDLPQEFFSSNKFLNNFTTHYSIKKSFKWM